MFDQIDKIVTQINEEFPKRRILVVGDLMLDRYLWGEVTRISPEGPVPIVQVTKRSSTVGGAANVALNLAKLGVSTALAGYLGADSDGKDLLDLLKDAGIEIELATTISNRPTTTKMRVIGGHQQMMRLDFEETSYPSPEDENRFYNQLLSYLNPDLSGVILSDYNKGVLSPRVCQAIITLAKKNKIPVYVDPKGRDFSKYRGATMISPNRFELSAATGATEHDLDALLSAGDRLRRELDLQFLVVTLGEHGIAIVEPKGIARYDTTAREVFDVSGAGDTVIAVLAASLASGIELHNATRLADLAAGVVVGKVGTAPISKQELLSAVETQRSIVTIDKLMTLEQLETQAALWRQRSDKIVFTNGCFDILHPGHINLLNDARREGDRLVVGLNTDRSVKALKGPSRPVILEYDRAHILSALTCVDAIVLFDEETPCHLISRLKPEVLVKGGDYSKDQIVGREVVESSGGKVVIVPLTEGQSTTSIIQKISKKS